ncbi:MAG: lipopolysaccharide biosynthesis protein [Planctomycetota bacterium]
MRTVADPTIDTSPAGDAAISPSWLDRVGQFAVGEDVRRAFLAVLDQALVSGLSFATSAIIATSCGRTGLGVAHLALTLLFLMMNVQGELLNAPYTVYRSRKQGRHLHAYSGSLFVHQMVLAACGTVAIVTLIGLNAIGVGPAELAPSLWVLLFASPFCLLHTFIRYFSFAAFQFRLAVAMDMTAAVLQLATLVVLVQLNMLTVPLLFAAMGASSLVACIGWFVFKPEPLRFVRKLVVRHWQENWPFGRWALASHVVGCSGNYVLPWMLAIVHDQAATGTFAGCGKLSALAATFVVGVAHFLSPKAVAAFAEHGVPGLKRVLFTSGIVFGATVGGFCLLVGLTGDFILVSLFGDDFAGTGPIALVLSLAVLANSMAIIGGNGLWALNRPQANLISDVVAIILTLSTAAVLVYSHGVMGIAIATVIGATGGAAVRGATLAYYLNRVPSEVA